MARSQKRIVRLAAFSLLPILIALIASLIWLKLPRSGLAAIVLNPAVITAPELAVDEAKPDPNAIASHRVESDLPRYIIAPRLGVKARVIGVGTAKDNRLQAPTNIFDAGWYTKSAKPSDTGGALLMDGHFAGPTIKGLFGNADQLKSGDKIDIERGDGKIVSFEIIKVTIVPKNAVDAASLLISTDTAKLGLNIITCYGSYDSRTKDFSERLIINAVVVKNK